MTNCTAHGEVAGKLWRCEQPEKARGLCSGHLTQAARRRPLAPLRERSQVRREVIWLRVSPDCRKFVLAHPELAREALERAARRA